MGGDTDPSAIQRGHCDNKSISFFTKEVFLRDTTIFKDQFYRVRGPKAQFVFFFTDMETGGSPLAATFDTNNDGVVNALDQISNGSSTATLVAVRQEGYLPQPVFLDDISITGEEAIKVKSLRNVPVGRFAWQELLQ